MSKLRGVNRPAGFESPHVHQFQLFVSSRLIGWVSPYTSRVLFVAAGRQEIGRRCRAGWAAKFRLDDRGRFVAQALGRPGAEKRRSEANLAAK
jgi:hypothetical protein